MIKTRSKKILQAVLLLFFCALIGLQSLAPFVGKAAAADPSSIHLLWLDRAHIKITSVAMTDSFWNIVDKSHLNGLSKDQVNTYMNDQLVGQVLTISNNNGHFGAGMTYAVSSAGCITQIGGGGSGLNPTQMKWQKISIHPSGQSCVDLTGTDDFQITTDAIDEAGKNIVFNWKDANTLVRVDGGDGDFQNIFPDQPTKFYKTSDKQDSNQDYVEVTADGHGIYHMRGANCISLNDWFQPVTNGDSCDGGSQDAYATVDIGGVENKATPGTLGDTNSSSNASADLNCPGFLDNPLNWLTCGLAQGAVDAVGKLDDLIDSLLTINTNGFMDTSSPDSTGAQFYTAWSSFRDISLGLLVIIALIMIISQAFGTGVFDAYTIRKVLPRIVIAVIGITLSWELMKFTIQLSNAAGHDVRALISAPFNPISIPITGKGGFFALGAVGVAAGAGLIALGGLGVLSFALTALIAVIVGLATLLFRQILIMTLVIFAPVAIVASILPNTQKAWKTWLDWYMKALIAFPIIAGFIAMGRVFAKISGTMFAAHQPLGTIMAFGAYFAPYFMIPTAFRIAGGAVASASALLNDRTKGLSEGVKGYRANERAKKMQELKTGERYSDRNALTRRINSMSQGIGTGGVTGVFGLSQRGKANVERARNARQAERMKEPGVQDGLFDDDVRLAVMSGSASNAIQALKDKNKSEDEIKKTMGMARSIGFDRSSQLAALNFEAANKSRNFVAGVDEDGNFRSANDVMQENVKRVAAQTGVDSERLLQNYMYAAGQNGRMDLRDKDLEAVTTKRFNTRDMAGSTDEGWRNIAGYNMQLLKTGSKEQKQRAGAQLLAMQESLASTSEAGRAAFIKVMEDGGVNYGVGGSVAMEQQLAGIANIEGQSAEQTANEFRRTSSTYSQGTPGAVVREGETPPPAATPPA